jgi:hypothetical protein
MVDFVKLSKILRERREKTEMAFKCNSHEATRTELRKLPDNEGGELGGLILSFAQRNISQVENGRRVNKDVTICTMAELDEARSNAAGRPIVTGKEFEFIVSTDLKTQLKRGTEGHYACATMTGTKKVTNGNMRVYSLILSDENYLPGASSSDTFSDGSPVA